MTITALGPRLAVSLNGIAVSSIDLEEWTIPGKRPDGSGHQFKSPAIGHMAQRLPGATRPRADCWFKNITLKTLKP